MRITYSLTTALAALFTTTTTSPLRRQEELLSIYGDTSCTQMNERIGIPENINNTCRGLPGDGFKLNYYEVGISVRVYYDIECQQLAYTNLVDDLGKCYESAFLNSYQIHSIWDKEEQS